RGALEAFESLRRLFRAGDLGLALAVIAEAAGLEDRFAADPAESLAPLFGRRDFKKWRGLQAQLFDKGLFAEPVLGHRQGMRAGAHRHMFSQMRDGMGGQI